MKGGDTDRTTTFQVEPKFEGSAGIVGTRQDLGIWLAECDREIRGDIVVYS
jgi:hypothetical protein